MEHLRGPRDMVHPHSPTGRNGAGETLKEHQRCPCPKDCSDFTSKKHYPFQKQFSTGHILPCCHNHINTELKLVPLCLPPNFAYSMDETLKHKVSTRVLLQVPPNHCWGTLMGGAGQTWSNSMALGPKTLPRKQNQWLGICHMGCAMVTELRRVSRHFLASPVSISITMVLQLQNQPNS